MLSSLGLKLAILAGVAIAAFAGGFTLEYRLASGEAAKVELAHQQAYIKAVEETRLEQQRFDAIATAAAQKEATAQARIAAGTAAQLREIKRHVQADSTCVRWGLVRVLDAAIHGSSAERLILPAGKSDASCSPITAVELAASVIGNYGTCHSNAEQLDALIASLRAGKRR